MTHFDSFEDGQSHQYSNGQVNHFDAKELVANERERVANAAHQAIQDDFTNKLMEHKKAQTGNDFRLFGHTMASYEQLSNHVKHNQCV